MRSLKKNMQPFYYVTHDVKKVYDHDENGNIKYIELDGEKIQVEIEKEPSYNDLVLFMPTLQNQAVKQKLWNHGKCSK